MKSHALKTVRLATGKSRPRFGALIGVTEHSIKRIENGRMKLSKALAKRIELATGADSVELLNGEHGRAVNARGDRYTESDFEPQKVELANCQYKQKKLTHVHDVINRLEFLSMFIIKKNDTREVEETEFLIEYIEAWQAKFNYLYGHLLHP